MCESALGSSVYRGYGYDMISKSRFSGKTGKDSGLGWVTSGGLGGRVGVESIRDRVSGGEDCNGGASDSSRKD